MKAIVTPSIPTEFTGEWYALQTLPRAEKKLAAWLDRHALPHFLPLRRKLHVYASKTATFGVPLFSGYVFASFSHAERTNVFRSNAIVRVLRAPKPDALCVELDHIRRALEAEAPLEPYDFVKEGQRVRITSGNWSGVEGTVVRVAGAVRVVLGIDFLGTAVAFEVDSGLLTSVC